MIVTYYYPWGYFYPPRAGADTMACAHLRYFQSRGYRPRVVLSNVRAADRSTFERHYGWLEDLVVIDAGRQPEIHRRLSCWDLGDHLAAHAMLAECRDVRRALSRPADVAFINYVFGTPLLDAIPRGAFRVLESVDIMSHQYLRHRESPARLQRLLATELSLYDLYDQVLMINKQEEAYAKARCQTNVAYVARAIDVADETAAQATNEQSYDLLFVGTDHPPNIEGVSWFYTHVFEPCLKAQGLRWAIVGSVGAQLSFRDAQVDILGKVDDLGSLYRRCKTVVVPLFRGAGISIKTLEAMGQRKAVVTTPCGRRGLLGEADGALVCLPFQDDPREVAESILTLCSSPALRQEYGRRAADYVSEHFGVEAYGGRMDELLAPLFGRGGREPANEATLVTSGGIALPRSLAAA